MLPIQIDVPQLVSDLNLTIRNEEHLQKFRDKLEEVILSYASEYAADLVEDTVPKLSVTPLDQLPAANRVGAGWVNLTDNLYADYFVDFTHTGCGMEIHYQASFSFYIESQSWGSITYEMLEPQYREVTGEDIPPELRCAAETALHTAKTLTGHITPCPDEGCPHYGKADCEPKPAGGCTSIGQRVPPVLGGGGEKVSSQPTTVEPVIGVTIDLQSAIAIAIDTIDDLIEALDSGIEEAQMSEDYSRFTMSRMRDAHDLASTRRDELFRKLREIER